MNMRRILPFALSVLMALPSVASAAQAVNSFKDLANTVVTILNSGVVLLITAMLVYYFYGIVRNIADLRAGKSTDGLRTILWRGLLIIFVTLSIWGIVQLLQYSIFGSPQAASGNTSGYYTGPQ